MFKLRLSLMVGTMLIGTSVDVACNIPKTSGYLLQVLTKTPIKGFNASYTGAQRSLSTFPDDQKVIPVFIRMTDVCAAHVDDAVRYIGRWVATGILSRDALSPDPIAPENTLIIVVQKLLLEALKRNGECEIERLQKKYYELLKVIVVQNASPLCTTVEDFRALPVFQDASYNLAHELLVFASSSYRKK